ncbi:hypothetical protein ABZY31_16285 [Streptomyces sp. NPDC006529]|uniref:hypothetical protein n=1 Tax=Streptomyces sp. NPDC006529 TaxID=3157177 RepID=UPI0033B8F387
MPTLSIHLVPEALPAATIHVSLLRRPIASRKSNKSLFSCLPAPHGHSFGYFLESDTAASRLAQQALL